MNPLSAFYKFYLFIKIKFLVIISNKYFNNIEEKNFIPPKSLEEEIVDFYDLDYYLRKQIILHYEPFRDIIEKRLNQYDRSKHGSYRNYRLKFLWKDIPPLPFELLEEIDAHIK